MTQATDRSSARGVRRRGPDEFFIDLMFTSRKPDEIVTGVTVPKLPDGRLPLHRHLHPGRRQAPPRRQRRRSGAE